MNKKTVVIGASENPIRYSYKATLSLVDKQHEVIPIGIRSGKIAGLEIITNRPLIENVNTVTIYVSPLNQEMWKSYVESLNPQRIIFNPGTENPTWQKELIEKNIEVIEACTLVMLAVGNY